MISGWSLEISSPPAPRSRTADEQPAVVEVVLRDRLEALRRGEALVVEPRPDGGRVVAAQRHDAQRPEVLRVDDLDRPARRRRSRPRRTSRRPIAVAAEQHVALAVLHPRLRPLRHVVEDRVVAEREPRPRRAPA